MSVLPLQDDNEVQTQFELEREGEESLATWWRQATPGTTYWRCFLPAKYLPGQCLGFRGKADIEYDEDTQHLSFTRTTSDTFIWQFLGDDLRSRLALKMQEQDTQTFMEIDDNYITIPPTHNPAWSKTHTEAVEKRDKGISTGYSHEMHKILLPKMNGIICATEYLADVYYDWNPNVYVCPNSVDPTDWNVERHTDDVLRIGYYGSASHLHDWPLIKKTVKKLNRMEGVEFMCIGFTPPGWSGLKAEWKRDIFDARQNLGLLDVGLAPLKEDPWSKCKSDVKALEYAMAGVMPVLQDAMPYDPWRGRWDFMPKTPDDWEETIMHIVKNRDKVKDWAAQAKEYVLAERTIQDNIVYWRDTIGA